MSPSIPELEVQLNSVTDQRTRIDILNELAWSIHLADPEKGRRYSEQAYELATAGEFVEDLYLAGVAGSLRTLAALNNDAGNYDVALSQSLRALEILEEISDGAAETTIMSIEILGTVSWTYRSFGDYGVSAEHAIKALKMAQAVGDRKLESGMLNILSVIYAESNDLQAALDIGQKVVQNCREMGHARGESIALNNLAMTYLELGNGAQALETCSESLRLARENGIEAVALTALGTIGEIYLGIQDFVHAEEYLLQALNLARQHKAGSDELQCLLNLGKLYQSRENHQSAISSLKSALSISLASSDRRGEFQCYQLLAEIYEKKGEFQTALEYFKHFHTLKESVFNENAVKRLSSLQVTHQVETAKREAEIHYLQTIELKREIEERKNVQDTLERLATLDPLTALLNRRQFFLLSEGEFQRAVQGGQFLTVILFDLDHLKRINDTYGHAIGDQVIIHVAKVVRESLRQDELIGRYGGDEFVILLPGSDCSLGGQIAGRLRDKISSQKISTSRSDLSLTLSLGVAELRDTQSASLEALLEYADQALYEAKRAGRNQFAIFRKS